MHIYKCDVQQNMTLYNNKDDQKIVLAMIQDESDISFEIFYKHFYNRLFMFIVRKIKNTDTAKEIVNDTFYKIYINKNKIKLDANFSAYFYTIAYNELRQNLRKKKDILLDNEMLEILIHESEHEDVIGAYENSELYLLVTETLKTLTEDEQDIIDKRFTQEKSLQEISEIMNMPLGTVKSKVSRTIAKIKDKIATNYKDVAYN